MGKATLRVFPIRGSYSHCEVGGRVYDVFSPFTEVEKEVAFQLIAQDLVGICRVDETGKPLDQISAAELKAGIAKYKADAYTPTFYQAPTEGPVGGTSADVLKIIADQKSVIDQQAVSIAELSTKVDELGKLASDTKVKTVTEPAADK